MLGFLPLIKELSSPKKAQFVCIKCLRPNKKTVMLQKHASYVPFKVCNETALLLLLCINFCFLLHLSTFLCRHEKANGRSFNTKFDGLEFAPHEFEKKGDCKFNGR
ncbi:hypothetical protein P8452_29826 [Trifolium repens]|nr:hypothetical protein P8452_29826 [Trifolium repens]